MLDTAIDLLVSDGAQEVTAARVAEQAEVARTTVYRQWPDQRSLLLATVHELTAPHHPTEVAGPIDDDVRATLETLRARMIHRNVRSIFGTLAGYAPHDAAFRDAQVHFVNQLTQPLVDALEAAVERGELHASADCTFEAKLLAGPLLHCHLALYDTIADSLIDEVIERWQTSRADN